MDTERKMVGFRIDSDTKQLLEDIARASGYDDLQSYFEEVTRALIEGVDPAIMRTVSEIRARRGTKLSGLNPLKGRGRNGKAA